MELRQDSSREILNSKTLIAFGPYEVDPGAGEIRKHQRKIRLAGQPLDILILLLEHPGEVVSREQIRQRLWPGNTFVDFERSLNSAVKKLRQVLNDDPQKPRYIETIPRKGYRFIGVIEASSGTPASMLAGAALEGPPIANSAPESAGPQTPLRRFLGSLAESNVVRGKFKRRSWIIALLILSAIAGVALFRRHRTHLAAAGPSGVKNTNFRSSIAVLGFKNLSRNHDADWLSTAISQMLSTELGGGDNVRLIPEEVVARATRDLRLPGEDGYAIATLRALRAKLDCDYVVAGSYVTIGNRNSGQVRMDLRLQETISAQTLASIAVSGKQSQLLDLVSHAGQQVRHTLASTVPPEGDIDWRTVLPSDAEAARFYSEGLARLRVFDNVAARDALQKCVALTPDFAPGQAALAEAWSALGYDARGQEAAQKALALSTSLPEDERLAIEGRYFELNHDWIGAIEVYRHLWQDFPDDLESGLHLAAAQTSAGKADDALATLSGLRSGPVAQRSDPRIDLAEAAIAASRGDYRQQQQLAEEAGAKARSTGAHLLLARARLVKGWALDDQSRLGEAKEAYFAAKQVYDDVGDGKGTATALNDIGIVLQKEGDLGGAEQSLMRAGKYFSQIGDQNSYGAALTNLGEVYRVEGRLSDAEDVYREAIRTFNTTGRKDNEYVVMNDLGGVLYERGEFRRARKVYQDLLAARQSSGDRPGAAIAKGNLASVLRVQGELDPALAMYQEALDALKAIGDRSSRAQFQLSFARTLIAAHDFNAARRSLQEALATNLQIGAKGDAAMDRIVLMQVSLEEGQPSVVDSSMQSSIDELMAEGRGSDAMEALAIVADARLAQKHTQDAESAVQRARTIRNSGWLANFHLSTVDARLQAERGNMELARRKLNALNAAAKNTGCSSCQQAVHAALSLLRF
jgi:eukaryotic-like serine/threonine-protein kinase